MQLSGLQYRSQYTTPPPIQFSGQQSRPQYTTPPPPFPNLRSPPATPTNPLQTVRSFRFAQSPTPVPFTLGSPLPNKANFATPTRIGRLLTSVSNQNNQKKISLETLTDKIDPTKLKHDFIAGRNSSPPSEKDIKEFINRCLNVASYIKLTLPDDFASIKGDQDRILSMIFAIESKYFPIYDQF